MAKSYANTIDAKEVSIAIEQVLIAPYNTVTWDPSSGKINVSSPPSGFTHLGAVVEDTPQLTITRENFQLKTGIPKVLQYQAVMTLAGQLQFTLYSASPRKLAYALGNIPAFNVIDQAPVSIASVNAASFQIAMGGSLSMAVGDYMITVEATGASTTALQTSVNEAKISAITDNSTFGVISFAQSDWFSITPIAAEWTSKILSVVNPFGTAKQRQYHILGVADFIDGFQVVHELQKVQPSGDIVESFKPDNVGLIPVQMEAFGYTTNRYPGLTDELVVSERFFIPNTA